MRRIAALCVSGRSIYKHLPAVMAFDAKMNARTFPGGMPVVVHPPCRLWSRYLRYAAKPLDAEAEMELGRFCVRMVRENGGVLEHPALSWLFPETGMPYPGDFTDDWGGYTLEVEQYAFGYATQKPTWIYIAGVPFSRVPKVPERPYVKSPDIQTLGNAARSRTMPAMANWLCQIARRAKPPVPHFGMTAISKAPPIMPKARLMAPSP